MPQSLQPRRSALKRRFDRLAKKQNATAEDLQVQIDVAGQLAVLNAKTMTVEEAQEWAREHVQQSPHHAEWAWRFVGRVEQQRESRRGPKSDADQEPPSDVYDPIVLKARQLCRHQGFDLNSEELGTLLLKVNRLSGTRMLPPINKQELRQILRRINKQKGS